MADTFALHGLDEILAKMRGMPDKLVKSGAKKAVRKGAVVVQKAAQVNARKFDRPQTPNSIPDNIAVQYSNPLSKKEGGVAYRVGVLGGAKKLYANTRGNRRKGIVGQQTNATGGSTWYWRFLELGTRHISKETYQFMVPALTSNIDKATNTIIAALGPALDNAVKKGR